MAGGKGCAIASGDEERPLASFEQLLPSKIHKVSDALEDVGRTMLGDAHGLGFTETRILAYLAENTSASVIDISRDLRIDKAWISRRLNSMVSKKLIAKKPHEFDSRAIIASLTSEGKMAAERNVVIVRQTYGTIMNGVDEAIASDIINTLEANIQGILLKLRSEQK